MLMTSDLYPTESAHVMVVARGSKLAPPSLSKYNCVLMVGLAWILWSLPRESDQERADYVLA